MVTITGGWRGPLWPVGLLRAQEESSAAVRPLEQAGRTQGSQRSMSAAGRGQLLTHGMTNREVRTMLRTMQDRGLLMKGSETCQGLFPWLPSGLCLAKHAPLLQVCVESVIRSAVMKSPPVF